eukprot:TRINITY_DN8078_c0_g1_i1.p1 TRINITY_DN8078_c0_g1~~TRINITY_DN8078_c0_g1_i1.p1  ORF type:complete len:79 (-),score=16.68 TRINITY_DN8078_c0_g1_i1:228-464(-)
MKRNLAKGLKERLKGRLPSITSRKSNPRQELIKLKNSAADFRKIARRKTVQAENRELGTLGTEQPRRKSLTKAQNEEA